MKICVAQIKPIKGDITANVIDHLKWIDLAISENIEVIIFPELSLTGYEPTLAKELATTAQDKKLDVFQVISDLKSITIGVGLPIQTDHGICIGMVIFAPNHNRQTYFKMYLHADEEPFFVLGHNVDIVIDAYPHIALAICYEISIPEHAILAKSKNAKIYMASVAKSEKGVLQAYQRLSDIARLHHLTVLFSNSIGASDDFISCGQSAVWNINGELLGNLNANQVGLLILDQTSNTITKKII